MVDVVSPAVRSRMMAGIRGSNTKPELVVRKGLHARGFRFRLHADDVPGKPDLILPRFRAAIFVHGCFWHGHHCHLFKLPSTRREFWSDKIGRNRIRDNTVRGQLDETGWRRLVIWECALKGRTRLGVDDVLDRTEAWLRGSATNGEIEGRT
ncbi:very short patch repair endonuclease [Radicibacter daui]|uniref:very short patch repair endonuclease n=1 Tax=Radicibacter daui TaxID=3064829 RepID=UPI004046DEB3